MKAPGCAGSRGSADDAQVLVVLGEEVAVSAVGTVAGAEWHHGPATIAAERGGLARAPAVPLHGPHAYPLDLIGGSIEENTE